MAAIHPTDLNLSDDMAVLLALLHVETDFTVFAFMPAEPTAEVPFFQVEDEKGNRMTAGTSPFNDSGWTASFPHAPNSAPIHFPVSTVREVADAVKENLGETVTVGGETYRNFAGSLLQAQMQKVAR